MLAEARRFAAEVRSAMMLQTVYHIRNIIERRDKVDSGMSRRVIIVCYLFGHSALNQECPAWAIIIPDLAPFSA